MAITRIPLVALWCAIALVLVLMGPTQANAQQQGVSASRSISPSPVPAGGGEATVTINIAGYSRHWLGGGNAAGGVLLRGRLGDSGGYWSPW